LGRALELRLERIDAHPAPVRNLADVGVDRAVVAPVVHPAILVLGAERAILRVVLELVQELERTREPELLLEPARNRLLHLLAPARVRAARVRPVVRPERLGRSALLQQKLVVAVEHEDRERAMQHARARVAVALRLSADLPIELVDEDQLLRFVGYDLVTRHLVEPPSSRASPENPPPVSRSLPIHTPRPTRRSRRSSRRRLRPSASRRARRSRARSSRAALAPPSTPPLRSACHDK